jgi:hypothetical protein
VRLARIIPEGVLVTAIAALVYYPFRHHPVAGLLLVIGVCLLGIAAVTAIEHLINKSKRAKAALPGSTPRSTQTPTPAPLPGVETQRDRLNRIAVDMWQRALDSPVNPPSGSENPDGD